MNIPFLQRIQAFAGPALHKVVGDGAAGRIMQRVLDGLPELLAGAVIHLDTGQLAASYTTSREFNPQKAAAFNAEVVKQQRQAVASLRLPDEQLEDILITLSSQLHLLRVLADGQHVLYVAVDARDTNLGIARQVLRSCDD